MQKPHQSDPVKLINTDFFSALAEDSALDMSVSHDNSAAQASQRAAPAMMMQRSLFMRLTWCFRLRFSVATQPRHFNRQTSVSPSDFSSDNRRHRFAFERPAIERAVGRFAGRAVFVEH